MDHTIHGILQARILECVHFPFPGDLRNMEIEPRSPTLQVDSLPAEPQWKPKNIGVGSLSLLQGIFPTQGLNQGLLHCRHILYQLSYQEAHPEHSATQSLQANSQDLEMNTWLAFLYLPPGCLVALTTYYDSPRSTYVLPFKPLIQVYSF